MGCDGGTIPKRDELVRTKKKKEQKDKTAELNFRWRCCSISQDPLQKPVVACGLGKLYSKDSVITGLLDRSALPESASHIKSLKDVRELTLTENPAFKAKEEKGDGYVDHQSSPYICPVIGIEMNGKFKFCFPWSCGCVVSERAMKQIKSQLCHKCQKPVDPADIVILNAADEDLELMKVRTEARAAKARAEKKAKKLAKHAEEPQEQPSASTSSTDNNLPSSSKVSNGKHSNDKGSKPLNGVKRPALNLGMINPDMKKTKSEYSVAKDPKASDVYKSIFTSSSTAKNQTKAHWVTYNPFYN